MQELSKNEIAFLNEVNAHKSPIAQEGGNVDKYGNSIISTIKHDPNLDRSFYEARTNTINTGTDYDTWADKDKLLAHENYHAQQYKSDQTNYDIAHHTEDEFQARLQKKPVITSTDDIWENYHDRKEIEIGDIINNDINNSWFLQKYMNDLNTFSPSASKNVSSSTLYNRLGIDERMYHIPGTMEADAVKYEETGKKSFQQGGSSIQQTPQQKRASLQEIVQKNREEIIRKKEDILNRNAAARGMTREDVQAQQQADKNKPDAQLDGLNTTSANKRCDTKGSCSTGATMGGDSLKDVKQQGGIHTENEINFLNEYAQEGARIKNEREEAFIKKDNFEKTQDKSLLLKQMLLEQQDKAELSKTGAIKNPRSITFQDSAKRLRDKQTFVSQDNLTPQKRKEYNDAMEKVHNESLGIGDRPLIYLADPSKIIGDLGVKGFNTSEEDRQKINLNRYNPVQSRSEQFKNNIEMGLGYVPEATANVAMATVFAPESAGIRGILNETLNPLAGIKNYSTNIVEDATPSYGLKEKAKQFFTGRAIVPPTRSLPIENLDNIVDQQIRYLDSDEYINKRIANTGENRSTALKAIEKYKKKFENTNIYLDDTATQNQGFYSPGLKLLGMNPNIGIASGKGVSKEMIEGTAMHEINHALSPNNPRVYNNFPLLNVDEVRKDKAYQLLPEEQQVRFNKMKFFMEDTYGKKAGTDFTDSDIERLLNTDSRFPTMHGNEKYRDAYDFVNATKYAEQNGNYKEALKNALNKSWAILPVAGATTLTSQNNEVKQEGGKIIKDNMGQYNHAGDITQISSPSITMKNVPYNIFAVADTGETKMLKPEQDYYFKGAKTVTEYPQLTDKEKAFLKAVQNYKNKA